MGQYQLGSFSQRFVRTHLERQIEDQSTQLALMCIRILCKNHGHKLFHVEQKHFMIAVVLLSQVQCHVSRVDVDATNVAVRSQHLQDILVLPQGMEFSVCQCAFNVPSGFSGQVCMQCGL